MSPDWQVYTGACEKFENVHSTWEKLEIIAEPQQSLAAADHQTDKH